MRQVVVLTEKCRRCGCCVRSCPQHALKLGEHAAEVNGECIGCKSCIRSCPFDAIVECHEIR